jgi:hypothetical protein
MEVELQQLPETSEIKRLDDDTVRRITAEQAISDLASIVKELMDNALDAESTTIKSEYHVVLFYIIKSRRYDVFHFFCFYSTQIACLQFDSSNY